MRQSNLAAMNRAYILRHWKVFSLTAWLCVWAFWMATTYTYHPTYTLAIIVTYVARRCLCGGGIH